jgi:ABC-2 type transport system permease protein
MGRNFQSGQITIDLIKPIDYQVYMFFYSLGGICLMCVTTFIPTFIIVYYASGRVINLDINVPYYALSIMLSIGINFCINFFVGTICFYTGSIWGVNMMKEVIVSLLSGATIPLAFFPNELRKIVDVLPFHSIYNTPLTVLVDKSLHVSDYNGLLCEQLMWLVVLAAISRIFFLIARKNMTVNGG